MTGALTAWAEWFWPAMTVHLWQSSIVLLFAAVAARVMRRAPASAVAALWSIAVVKFWLPPQVLGGLTRAIAERWPSVGVDGAQVVAVWSRFPADLARSFSSADDARAAGGLPVWLTVLWIAGAAGLAVAALRRGRGRIGRLDARPLAEGPASRRLRRAARAAGIPLCAIRTTERRVLPMVHGLRRPRIIVPDFLARSLAQDELEAVLLHEEAHRRRRDPLRAMLLALTVAVFFFFPPVWWLARRLREATEAACDEAAVRRGVPVETYRRSLLRTISLGLAPAASPAAIHEPGASPLRRRLQRLDELGRTVMTHAHRLCFAAVLLAIAACVLLPWSSVPVPAAPIGGSGDGATAPGFKDLDRLADGGLPITLELDDVPLERILEAIESRVPGLDLRPGDDLVRDQRASIDLSGVPLKVALTRLGLAAGLRYDVLDARTLVVHPVLLSGVDGVTRPTLIDKVEVAYPEALRAQGLTAEIVLQAVVEVDGSVTDVQVLRDSAPEHPEFAQSAVEAVSRWRYAPATLADGQPVPVYFTLFINFKLR